MRRILLTVALFLGLAFASWVQFAHAQTAPVATKITSNDGAKVVAVTSTALGNALLVQPASSAPITFPTSTLPVSVSGTVIVSGSVTTTAATSTNQQSVTGTLAISSLPAITGAVTNTAQTSTNEQTVVPGQTALFSTNPQVSLFGGYEPSPYPLAGQLPSVANGGVLSVDQSGQLIARVTATTDEGSIRDDFAGTSLTSTVGLVMAGPSDQIVGSGTTFTTSLNYQRYWKLDSDPESAWTQIKSVEDDTHATLEANYPGTSSTSPTSSSWTNWPTVTVGTTTSLTVGQSLLSMSVGTSTGSLTLLRTADTMPAVAVYPSVSWSNQSTSTSLWLGYLDLGAATSTNPGQQCRVFLDGATSTLVRLQSNGGDTDATYGLDNYTFSLPNNGTTATAHAYKIAMTNEACSLYIDKQFVGANTLHIPGNYIVMGAGMGVSSTNATVSSTAVIDVFALHDDDRVETADTYDVVVPADGMSTTTPMLPTLSAQLGYNASTTAWDRQQIEGSNFDAEAVQTTGLTDVSAHVMTFNGSAWDRLRGSSSTGLTVGAWSDTAASTLQALSANAMGLNVNINSISAAANRLNLYYLNGLPVATGWGSSGPSVLRTMLSTDSKVGLSNINGAPLLLGSTTMAQSIPVVIASNQGAFTVNATLLASSAAITGISLAASGNSQAALLYGADPTVPATRRGLTTSILGEQYVYLSNASAAGAKFNANWLGGFPVVWGWGPSVPGAPRVTISTDSKVGLSNVNGATLLLGSTTMAKSLPVTMATDQGLVIASMPGITTVTTTKTLVNTNDYIAVNTSGYQTIGTNTTSTAGLTVAYEATVDGSSWYPVPCANAAGTVTQTTGYPYNWWNCLMPASFGTQIRVRLASTTTTGAVVVQMVQGTAAPPPIMFGTDGVNGRMAKMDSAGNQVVVAPAATWSGASCMGVVTSTQCLTATSQASAPYVTDLYFSANGAETLWLYSSTSTGPWGSIPATSSTMLWRADCSANGCGPIVGLTSPIPVAASSSFYCVPSSVSVSSTCTFAVRGL